MTLQNHEGLLPCPFCGGKASTSLECYYQTNDPTGMCHIGCDSCDIGFGWERPDYARKKWNHRKATPHASQPVIRPHEDSRIDSIMGGGE